MSKQPIDCRRGILPRCARTGRHLYRNAARCRVYIALATTLLLIGCGKPAHPAASGKVPERIVSLAPNITETIYALGIEDKLVGDTTYCRYPAAAQSLPKIGGFGSINYEAIVTLHPDLVILHKEYDADKERLDGLGIPYLETGTYFIADILDTIRDIGKACGAQSRADELVQNLENRIAEIRQVGQTFQSARPRVLITFGSGETDAIQAIGPACIHNELLELAGGQNVVEGKLPFAILSREAVMRLNPDIIIQLAPDMEPVADPFEAWKTLDSVNAVKNHRIHLLTGDYTCIPGPRFIQTLEDFSEIIRQND
ncbi:MAG: helical backbone metal receptor [Kiritimatiellales bacterium]|nr:helical backbone metal receptor [Kiritimatiellales bacterium]